MKRAHERRVREDEATRLRDEIPAIESLTLEIEAFDGEYAGAPITYTRHIVVERAPARFEIPCCDRRCRDGGHDITERVMEALEEGKTRFEGQDTCSGKGKHEDCHFKMKFVGLASYS